MDRQTVLFLVAHRAVERRLCPSLDEHYDVTVVQLRREALQLIEAAPPDLLLVDVPSIRFDITRFFDALGGLMVPVTAFLLLGKGMRLDQMPQVNGYLRHPFSAQQLVRRLSRVMPAGSRETVDWSGLCLDTENRFLIWDGQQVPLTPKQMALALIFLSSPDCIVTRELLMKEVWGTDYMGDTRTLDVHIHWLRKALAQVQAPFVLKTERRAGYRLVTAPPDECPVER